MKTTDYSLRSGVEKQLRDNLGNLKEKLGEKKFDKRIKKAVKLFTRGLKTKKVKAENIELKKLAMP